MIERKLKQGSCVRGDGMKRNGIESCSSVVMLAMMIVTTVFGCWIEERGFVRVVCITVSEVQDYYRRFHQEGWRWHCRSGT